MKNLVKILPLAAMVAMLAAACGSSDSTTSTTPNITSVDSLPRATSPVVSTTSSSISAVKGVSIGKASAATGVNLYSGLTAANFNSDKSMELCEAANQTKQVIGNAAMADKILCYVQNIVAANPTELSSIYDGQYHIVGLNITGGTGGTPDKVKMKIVKTGTAITGFEMFACSSTTQMEYINQTITSNEVSITSKGFYSGGGWAGAHQIEVTGNLNNSGYFTSKSMELDHYSGATQGSPTQWGESTVTQYADKMIFNGYDYGSQGENTWQNRVYSQYQLIDANTSAANDSYDIRSIAVGNGAAHGIFGGSFVDDQSKGWNGDTRIDDDTVTEGSSTTTWKFLVESTTPRAISATAPTIAFSDAQTWNGCEGTAEVTVSATETDLDTACAKLSYGSGDTWFNCYGSIQPGQ